MVGRSPVLNIVKGVLWNTRARDQFDLKRKSRVKRTMAKKQEEYPSGRIHQRTQTWCLVNSWKTEGWWTCMKCQKWLMHCAISQCVSHECDCPGSFGVSDLFVSGVSDLCSRKSKEIQCLFGAAAFLEYCRHQAHFQNSSQCLSGAAALAESEFRPVLP